MYNSCILFMILQCVIIICYLRKIAQVKNLYNYTSSVVWIQPQISPTFKILTYNNKIVYVQTNIG